MLSSPSCYFAGFLMAFPFPHNLFLSANILQRATFSDIWEKNLKRKTYNVVVIIWIRTIKISNHYKHKAKRFTVKQCCVSCFENFPDNLNTYLNQYCLLYIMKKRRVYCACYCISLFIKLLFWNWKTFPFLLHGRSPRIFFKHYSYIYSPPLNNPHIRKMQTPA